jgi:hypothetical protein
VKLTYGDSIPPLPRAGASITYANGKLVVFGGKDEDNNRLNDIWQYNMQE